MRDAETQRAYYARTASLYDKAHVEEDRENMLAAGLMLAAIDFHGLSSVLDVGSGTGRAIRFLKERRPSMRLLGVEPVRELREVGYTKGLSPDELVYGDGTCLSFPDASFDLVCEFGVLHHVKRPDIVVGEMLRVAKKAIFISDANNFGQGRFISRAIKQALDALGLWGFADFLKTRGRGYTISEGDGLAYSYSVFNNYRQIRKACRSVHLFSTRDAGPNIYRTSGHVALLGLK